MTRRVLEIVRADFLLRFRRPSTIVLFLLLSALAYLWVPAPSTGRALIRIGMARALYNSAAIGMATAVLATLFICVAGFYVVSNAVQSDVRTRCGSVLASTTIHSGEYLFGKFLGNVAFLSTFTAGFMVSAAAMQIVRGEAPLEPWTFARQYAVLVPASIVAVSAVAILFECIPPLAGRFGDAAYFFAGLVYMVMTAKLLVGRVPWGRYVDSTGLLTLATHIRETLNTADVGLATSTFDATRPLVILSGLPFDLPSIAPRIASALYPLVVLPVALLFFHRFDPARVRAGGAKSGAGWIARTNALTKPLTRGIAAVPLSGPVVADAMLSFAAQPLTLVALAVIVAATIWSAASTPLVFPLASLILADIASRDASQGTTALTWAAPHFRESFVRRKFASSLVVAAVLLAVPAVRIAAAHPSRIVAFLVGIAFVTAAATSLGAISSNAKAFTVLFLSFWYVVVNDGGRRAFLDFAGWNGKATAEVTAGYAVLAFLLIAIAELVHRARLARQ